MRTLSSRSSSLRRHFVFRLSVSGSNPACLIGLLGTLLGILSSDALALDPLAATVARNDRGSAAEGARTGPAAPATTAPSGSPAVVEEEVEVDVDVETDPDSEEAILKRLPELSTNYVVDLFGLYHRLNNQRMVNAVTAEIQRRDPSGVTLAAATASLPGGPDIADSPFVAIEDEADHLMNLGQAAEAVTLLEKSKAKLSPGDRLFPLEGQLASAYLAADRKDEAAVSFRRVVGDARFPAAEREEARNELAEIQLSNEIEVAYNALVAGDRRQALELARGLAALHPTNADVELLLGQTLTAAGSYNEAVPILQRLKATTPAGEVFAGQSDYADALYDSNNLEGAMAAYDELQFDPTQTEALRYEARMTSKEIHRKMADKVGMHTEYLSETEGYHALAELDAEIEVRKGLRIGAFGWYDYVSLSSDRNLIQDSGSSFGGYAIARQQIGQRHLMDVSVGGADYGKVIYGLGFGREAPNELFWGWHTGYYGNVRAEDSLQLIALDGRQDLVSGAVGGPLPFGIKLALRGAGRRVYAEDVELGDGFVSEISISRSVWNDSLNRRSLSLAYEGAYDKFNARSLSTGEGKSLGFADPTGGTLLVDDLIQPLYNAQGLALTFSQTFSDKLDGFFTLGANYNFVTDQIDWYASGGFSYLLGENLELLLEASYFSDGSAVASTASEVVVANLGMRYFY